MKFLNHRKSVQPWKCEGKFHRDKSEDGDLEESSSGKYAEKAEGFGNIGTFAEAEHFSCCFDGNQSIDGLVDDSKLFNFFLSHVCIW